MNHRSLYGPDPTQFRLRASLAKLEDCVERASAGGLSDDLGRPLRAAFVELNGQLALGPEPDLRECPQCRCVGFRKATICGNCWTRLEVLTALVPS